MKGPQEEKNFRRVGFGVHVKICGQKSIEMVKAFEEDGSRKTPCNVLVLETKKVETKRDIQEEME